VEFEGYPARHKTLQYGSRAPDHSDGPYFYLDNFPLEGIAATGTTILFLWRGFVASVLRPMGRNFGFLGGEGTKIFHRV